LTKKTQFVYIVIGKHDFYSLLLFKITISNKNIKWAGEKGDEREKEIKKKISETHRNSNYDIVDTIMKGHQRWSKWVTLAAKHKWATLTLWTISVAHSGYRWSLFLMSLNLSPLYFFYVTNVSKFFFFLFLSSFIFSLSFLHI